MRRGDGGNHCGFILGGNEGFRWEGFWATIGSFGQQLGNLVIAQEQEEMAPTIVGFILAWKEGFWATIMQNDNRRRCSGSHYSQGKI